MDRSSRLSGHALSPDPRTEMPPPVRPVSLHSRSDRSEHRLYVHLVWPTLARLPLIRSETAAVVEGHLIALCRRLDVEPLCVCAGTDRVHMLVRMKPVHSVGALVRRLKSGSEEILTTAGRGIRWGRGYAASSVGSREVRRTMRRIVHFAERARPVGGPLTRQTRTP